MKTKVKYLLGASILFLLAGCAANDAPWGGNDEPYDASSKGEAATGDYYTPTPSEDVSSEDVSTKKLRTVMPTKHQHKTIFQNQAR